MHRLVVLTTFAAFLLVIAGGLVTSTGSGLAVPDWPLSYGTLFPPMVGGIRFEHTHRLIAATVGLFTLILTLWILMAEKRRPVRRLAIAAFGLVVLQGILGGLTVLWQLPLPVSVAHACLGQTFFMTLAVLAEVTAPRWGQTPRGLTPPRLLLLWTTLALYGQLILGALLRHAGWQPVLVIAHLIGAAAATILVFRTSRLLSWLLLLQIGLGVATLCFKGNVPVSTAHVAVGALLLATAAVLTVRAYRRAFPRWGLSLYWELTKPRLTSLAVLMTLAGFLLASAGAVATAKLLAVLVGTALVGGGAGALNQYLERNEDGRMRRTCGRPLPSGRISPQSALAFGVILSITGLILLLLGAPPLAAGLAAATLGLYLFLYTPLKRRSALCTLVGAIPGALPPLIGWAGARGTLGLESAWLFVVLFLWQLPHFLAIAWSYREDYSRAGFRMLPVLDPEGGSTSRQISLYCLALVPVSLLPSVLGLAGWIYFAGALIISVAFLGVGLATAWARSPKAAHRLFLASLVYLPVLVAAMTLDRVIL
ncbi:MAG: protoheme IX farnesyltransferase [Candidatus Omnitrophica bacterium]|nr:protoheme IX farnesyltransferase [Candidatus Omnitrophota bacterium]